MLTSTRRFLSRQSRYSPSKIAPVLSGGINTADFALFHTSQLDSRKVRCSFEDKLAFPHID